MPDTHDRFRRDPEALAWARGHVERLRDRYRRFEAKARAEGRTERATQWRKFANLLQMELIGGEGCVYTPFDERLPRRKQVMPDTTQTMDPLAAYLAEVRERGQAATKGPWYNEPSTGAGRVWVQIGRKRHADADCEPLFNVRSIGTPAEDEKQQQAFRQRAADAAFIVGARSDVPRLLAALEAALVLAGEWCNLADDGLPASALTEDRDWVRATCADSLREIITRELLGKGETP